MSAYRRRALPALLVSAATVGALLAGAGTASATYANGLCAGTWANKVSNVTFQRGYSGTLAWGFKLTNQARSVLGPVVAVTMPYTLVNGKAINPPYLLHTEPNWYNFHGSINKFNYIGSSRKGAINTGEMLTFYWYLKGSTGNANANVYIRCEVPPPGSH